MIEMLEGVPGSGKSYYAVSERLLSWVRAGRRVYVYVDGFHLDRLALFEGRDRDELEKQVTLWLTAEEVKAGLLLVEPGSGVLIDEVQTVFRSKDKTDAALLRWLETHRHKGVDLVLMCQQYGQVTLGVNRLVEVTIKFRRLDRFGLKNRYQASVRGNPEEIEVIRMFSGRYNPKLYAYYSSYSQASARESVRGGSILKSPMLIVGVVGLVTAIGWFSFGGWLTGAKPANAMAAVTLPPPPPLPVKASVVQKVSEPIPVEPVRIVGGMTTITGKASTWIWLTEDGRFLSESEIAAESGGTVFSDMVRGVRVLKGTGIRYGGTKSVNDTMHAWPMMKKSEAPVVSVVPPVQGKPDPFLTPEFTSESLPSSPVPIPRGTR